MGLLKYLWPPRTNNFQPINTRISEGLYLVLGPQVDLERKMMNGEHRLYFENPESTWMHSGFENMPAVPVVPEKGGVPGIIPSQLEHYTGLARLEYLAELTGKPIFLPGITDTHFGTIHNPVKVPSIKGERIVGCSGPDDDKHRLSFFNVYHEYDYCRCHLCGQAFKIELVDPAPYRDRDSHY